MKAIAIGLFLAVILLIATNVYTFLNVFKKSEQQAAYWRREAFKPDTVYSSTHYTNTLKPIKGAEAMPPQTVIQYLPDPMAGKNFKVEFDTLGMITMIDSIMKSKVTVDKTYLTQYPTAHKIVGGYFSKDTASFDFLSIDGKIKREVYPVDYSLFKYAFRNNSMSAISLSTRERRRYTQNKFISYDGTYLNVERDFLNLTNEISLTPSLNIGRFRLSGFAGLPIPSNKEGKQLRAGGRVGYKLF
jgi:hypothetical protein